MAHLSYFANGPQGAPAGEFGVTVAPHLRGRGFNAQALLLQPATNAAVAAARAAHLPFLSSFPTPVTTDQTLFIDGLFGIGLSRPIEGRAAEWRLPLESLVRHPLHTFEVRWQKSESR